MTKVENIYFTVAKRIREERRKLNLTQEKLAEIAGISIKFMSRIESNAERPSLDMIVRLSNALNVPFLSLFVDSKDKNQLKSLKDKVRYLFPELLQDQQEHLTNIIKEARKLIK